jgi:hypothetical protein
MYVLKRAIVNPQQVVVVPGRTLHLIPYFRKKYIKYIKHKGNTIKNKDKKTEIKCSYLYAEAKPRR